MIWPTKIVDVVNQELVVNTEPHILFQHLKVLFTSTFIFYFTIAFHQHLRKPKQKRHRDCFTGTSTSSQDAFDQRTYRRSGIQCSLQ